MQCVGHQYGRPAEGLSGCRKIYFLQEFTPGQDSSIWQIGPPSTYLYTLYQLALYTVVRAATLFPLLRTETKNENEDSEADHTAFESRLLPNRVMYAA